MAVSRREFLHRVGRAGGYSAAFLMMRSMGFMEAHAAQNWSLDAAPGVGKGVKVVILGAGIAGLVAAYELRALGYECTLLECRAQTRRKKLDGARRRSRDLPRRDDTDLHLGRGKLPKFWTGPSAVGPQDDAGLLREAGCAPAGGSEHDPLRLPAKR